jgi:lysophospholipase L1-like esterase
VVVFYDENANGSLDGTEAVRVPGVVVEIAGRTGTSAVLTGLATVQNVPDGTHAVSVRRDSLPAYWEPGAAVSVTAPTTSEVRVPLTLPIGSNFRNVYLAFGDSITEGAGSSDDKGYPPWLEVHLDAHQGGEARTVTDGAAGTTSRQGAARLPGSVTRHRPAYTLILYGTNDWWEAGCSGDVSGCFTATSIQNMIGTARSVQSLPIVATIPPVNTGYDDRVPPERNEDVQRVNLQIKSMAASERVPVADIYAAMAAVSPLSSIFDDHVHPNDKGYEIIALEFFKAISRAGGTSTAGFGGVFLDLDADSGPPGFHDLASAGPGAPAPRAGTRGQSRRPRGREPR